MRDRIDSEVVVGGDAGSNEVDTAAVLGGDAAVYLDSTYTKGLLAIAVYSNALQFFHPTTRKRMITQRRYAKLVYRVHNALNRRPRCRSESNCDCDLDILVAKADKVFSNEAGELSSPLES